MAGKDYYRILKLEPGADAAAVKKAYRQLALAYHPDRNPNAHSGFFLEILEAYNTLSNPERRAAYDAARKRPGTQAVRLSPDDMLRHLRRLNEALSAGQARVSDRDLHDHLEEWLGDSRLLVLRHADEDTARSVAGLLLALMKRLPYAYYQPLLPRWMKIDAARPLHAAAQSHARSKYVLQLWHRYKILFVLLVSLALVGAMIRLGRPA